MADILRLVRPCRACLPLALTLFVALLMAPSPAFAQGRQWVEQPTAPSPIAGQKRLALLIGNTNYGGNHQLKNPQNDATAMAKALAKLGFTATVVLDANRDALRKVLNATLEAGKVLSLPVTLEKMEPVAPPPSGSSSGLATTKINPKDGAEMILIPEGEFLMGDNDQRTNPRRKVTLPAYYIYKNLVTVGMYEKFCKATNREMPEAPDYNPGWSKKEHPTVFVTRDDAKAYCDWAGGSLPSEAQWEKAARGTNGRQFPWGNEFDLSKLWCSKREVGDAGGTARVGSFVSGSSPYGVLDMAGNVRQWCSDWYDPSERHGVLRGSSWLDINANDFRVSNRYSFTSDPNYRVDLNGFRVVCAVP